MTLLHSQSPEPILDRARFSTGLVGRVSFAIFHWRRPLLILFVLLTALFAATATQLKVEAGFSKMLPLSHPYMKAFIQYGNEFGGANKVLIALRHENGTIYDKAFMQALREVTDEVFYVKGVERSSVTSLFTPNVRYNEVVEDGFRGGNVVGADFDGSPDALGKVRDNVLKSDWLGRIVARDMTAAMVVATLQETDPDTGARLDLQAVAHQLEAIRARHETKGVTVHVIGFAKSIGDIADGAGGVLTFFAIAFVITALLLFWYSGSLMLSAWALVCAMVPVVWLLGLLPLLGLALDPMSILVPFLIFSIGVSHAVQMTNAWKLETLHGHDGVTASRNCFQKLFIPGAMALLANALGFIVIAFVDIEMVRELALTATLGVSLMIVTNKMLLPILLSYIAMSKRALQREASQEGAVHRFWRTAAKGVE
ncbi:MAG: efflux RND transporter permease subunit, partial [Panacagrimonas sp.]